MKYGGLHTCLHIIGSLPDHLLPAAPEDETDDKFTSYTRREETKSVTHHTFGHGRLPTEANISVDVVVTRPEFEDRHRGKFHDFRRFQTSSEDRWHPVPFCTKFRVGHYQQVLPPLDAHAGTTDRSPISHYLLRDDCGHRILDSVPNLLLWCNLQGTSLVEGRISD